MVAIIPTPMTPCPPPAPNELPHSNRGIPLPGETGNVGGGNKNIDENKKYCVEEVCRPKTCHIQPERVVVVHAGEGLATTPQKVGNVLEKKNAPTTRGAELMKIVW